MYARRPAMLFAIAACIIARVNCLAVGGVAISDDATRVRFWTAQLESPDEIISAKAARELGRLVPKRREAVAPLLDALVRERNVLKEMNLIDALMQTPMLNGTMVIEALKRRPEFDEKALLRVAVLLAWLGPRASGATPFLLEQMNRQGLSERTRGALIVALANIGHTDGASTATILGALRARSDEGRGALYVLARSGCGAWAGGDVLTAVAEWLPLDMEEREDESAFAVLALAWAGSRANALAPGVEEQLHRAEGEQDSGAMKVVCGLCLAQIDSNRRQAHLSKALTCIAQEDDHSVQAVTMLAAASMDTDMVRAIIGCVDSPDRLVVMGALSTLQHLPYVGPETSAKVIALIKYRSDADIAQEAAFTLGAIADPSQAPQIELLLRELPRAQGRSTLVGEYLHDALRTMYLPE